jgi:hypothetical protein
MEEYDVASGAGEGIQGASTEARKTSRSHKRQGAQSRMLMPSDVRAVLASVIDNTKGDGFDALADRCTQSGVAYAVGPDGSMKFVALSVARYEQLMRAAGNA